MTTISPHYLTSSVCDLIAEYNAAVESKQPESWKLLPILRDALMDAGCVDDLDGLLWLAEWERVPRCYGYEWCYAFFRNDRDKVENFSNDDVPPCFPGYDQDDDSFISAKQPFAACLAFCESYAATDTAEREKWRRG